MGKFMQKVFRVFTFLGFIFTLMTVGHVASAELGTLAQVIESDGRLNTFRVAIDSAELGTMYASTGPYTVFAPTDAAFSILTDDSLTNANAIRSTLLHHTLQSAKNSGNLGVESVMRNALGKDLVISQTNGQFVLNGVAHLIVTDIEASNGILHLVDVVLDPNTQANPTPTAAPSQEGDQSSEPSEAPVQPVEPVEQQPQGLPESNLTLVDPSQNPAFKGEGHIAYWSGIQTDRTVCKGTTWIVMRQMDGVTLVGSDRQTNPYRGDTGCGTSLPLLCFNQDFSSPPATSSRGQNYANGWAGGRVRATVPVQGTQLATELAAQQLCEATFGIGWRVAEFHDAGYGADIGDISGWDMWAWGGLNNNQRYWVNVNDQAANPWNSVRPFNAPTLNTWADQVPYIGHNPAYIAGDKIQPNTGLAAGRPYCKGLTWTLLKQMDGMVLVGSDGLSNPYTGDTDCNKRLPVLCVDVEGFSPPASSGANNYSEGWSGANIAQTYPFSGHEINTREKANQKCVGAFGEGWRMAEFHDGSLGTAGTDGWNIWGFGGLTTNRRFWVSINDRAANPWNPYAGQ